MKHNIAIRLATIFGSVLVALLGLGVLFYGVCTSSAMGASTGAPTGSPPPLEEAPQFSTASYTSELEVQGWTNVGLYGANVRQAAYDPTRDDVYLAVDGEYYKSGDGGASWAKVIDRVGSGFVAVDPVSGTVYIGSGSEVLMSNDGGETWDVGISLAGFPSSIGLDPSDGQVAFVGTGGSGSEIHTNGHVYRTMDGGEAWISATVDIGYSICSVAVDPNNSGHVWAVSGAVCNSTFPDHSAVFSSTDRGQSYSLVLTSTNGNEYNQVVFGPTGVLYLAGEGIQASHNGGITFTTPTMVGQLFVFPLAINPVTGRAHLDTYSGGYYSTDGGLSWHYDGLPKIYAIDPENPLNMLGLGGTGLVRSVNGGATWQDAVNGLRQVVVEQIGGHPKYTQTLYASAHLGFARSLDGGASWEFPAGEIGGRCFAVNPDDPSIVYVCENGASRIFYSNDSGDSWNNSVITDSNATVTAVAVDQIVTTTVYASLSTHWQNPGGDTSRDGVFISTDSGNNWEFFGLAGEQVNAMVAVTDTNGSVVYAATGDRSVPANGGVYRWKTGEITWTLMGMSDAIVNDIAVDPWDPTHLYCAAGHGGSGTVVKGIFESFDSGENWSQVTLGSSPEIGNSVYFDPANPDIVYAGELRALYRTKDGGSSWSKLAEVVDQNVGFYSIYVSHYPDHQTIFVAMHDGAYYRDELWVYLPLVIAE